jgi:tetratricopeptide (TPR) repeat protein
MKIKNIISVAILGLSVLMMTSCGGKQADQDVEAIVEFDEAKFLTNLETIENSLTVDAPAKNDLQKAVTAFQDFANHFPEDDRAPDYLLKASDISLSLGQNEKSVRILNQIIEEHPNYEKMESVIYNRASHTDFELRDTAQARAYYMEFMEKYPESDFIDDAEARISQNFMSLEELVEMFSSNAE